MSAGSKMDLKGRIKSEMTVDHANAMEKHFDIARKYIRITSEGKVDLVVKEKFSGKEEILLYLIGKLYAKEAELAHEEDVSLKELMEELSIPRGSVSPWLSELRDKFGIQPVKRGKNINYSMPSHLIEKGLQLIERKINKGHQTKTKVDYKVKKATRKASNAGKKQKGIQKERCKIVGDLNLKPKDKKSLSDFYAEKNPKSNQEIIILIIYYLQHKLKVSNIGPDHVYTSFKELEIRNPSKLYDTIRITNHRLGMLNISKNDLTTNVRGENFIEHDLPRQDVSQKMKRNK